jgi:hypothetical protein
VGIGGAGVIYKSVWFFEYDSYVIGPVENAITPAGLAHAARLLAGSPSPWLALGNDTSSTFLLGETFRKAVTLVSQDGSVVRFRTALTPAEANGTHQKLSIFFNASQQPGGQEIMFNQLRSAFTKASNQLLTVECRIYVQEG